MKLEDLIEGYDPQNLDCIDHAELLKLKVLYKRLSINFETLSTYCDLKTKAMEARAAGDIQHAKKLELYCNNAYLSLGDVFQW